MSSNGTFKASKLRLRTYRGDFLLILPFRKPLHATLLPYYTERPRTYGQTAYGVFAKCHGELVRVVNGLMAIGIGQERVKTLLSSIKLRYYLQLQRQCQMLDMVVSFDTAAMAACT